MRDVEIKRDAVLEQLRLNRDQHRGLFEKAMDAYRDRVIEVLEDKLDRARAGKDVPRVAIYDIVTPEDHTEDYNVAIEMLEHEERKVLTLTQMEYKRYMMNRWEWESSFAASTMSYISD